MELLVQGARSDQVKLLQRLLNKRRIATPGLKEDGVFGPATMAAVSAFQVQQKIMADGKAGPVTWQKLNIRHDITHQVWLIPQPTNVSCWAASASMVLGNRSPTSGGAATPGGGLDPSPKNVEIFARSLNWQMHYPQSWSVSSLAGLLRRGPAWAVGGGDSPTGGWLHAIVLSALWSDGEEDGSGTMIRIHDPWPPNVGSVYGRFYRGTIDGFDFISLYVLQP